MNSGFKPAPAPRIAVVTGGTGFIGSHLVDALLRQGMQVRCLVRPVSSHEWARAGVQLVVGDLCGAAPFERLLDGADLIFHLGGAGLRRLRAEPHVNIDGTRHLAEAWGRHARGVPLVFLSSLKASRMCRREAARDSMEGNAAEDYYGYSKLVAEEAIVSAARAAAAGAIIIRAPAVYGPRDRNLVSLFRAARYGLLPEISGGVLPPFSHIYVRDLVQYMIDSACSAAGKVHIGEVESAGRADWNTLTRAINHWARPARAGIRLNLRQLVRVRGLVDRCGRAWPQLRNSPLSRLGDVLDGGLACDGANRAVISRGTDIDTGIALTGNWYKTAGWVG